MGAEDLAGHGSLLLIFVLLVAGGMGAPFPEEIVVISAGALAHRGVLPHGALTVSMAGVLVGDLLLFGLGWKLGPAARRRQPFRTLMSVARADRLETILRSRFRGPALIFAARWISGLRAPTFALAGVSRMPAGRFVLWDGLSLCLYGPTVFGLGWMFSEQLDQLLHGTARLEHWLLYLLTLAFVVASVVSLIGHQKRRSARRL